MKDYLNYGDMGCNVLYQRKRHALLGVSLITLAVASEFALIDTAKADDKKSITCLASKLSDAVCAHNFTTLRVLSRFGSYDPRSSEEAALLKANQKRVSEIYLRSSLSDKYSAVANAVSVNDVSQTSVIFDKVLPSNISNIISQSFNKIQGERKAAKVDKADLYKIYNYLHTAISIAEDDSSVAKDAFGTGTYKKVDLSNKVYGTDIYSKFYSTYAPNTAKDPRPYQTTTSILGNSWSRDREVPSFLQEQQWKAWFGGKYPSRLCAGTHKKPECGNSNSASFPSGHSVFGNTTGLAFAGLIPEKSREFLSAGIEFAYSRNVLGVHYPLDSIGGRIIAIHDMAMLLSGNKNYSHDFIKQVQSAQNDLSKLLGSSTPACGSGVTAAAGCITQGVFAAPADLEAKRQRYRYLLTYDLPSVGPTDKPMVVPFHAGHLLTARFPYLTYLQRNEVLRTTGLPSGVPLDNGSGWARLNLFDAAGGFGSLAGPTTVTMNAARGGYHALDVWDNDIGGVGSLDKAGSGTLVMTGRNSYSGGTTVSGGTLASLGTLTGAVTVAAGAGFVNAGLLDTKGVAVSNAGTFDNMQGAVVQGSVNNTGVVINDGTITGAVTNSGAATYSGNGTYGQLTVAANGVLAPGHSIGRIHVLRDIVLAPGATHIAEINPGQADLVTAGGTATLAGTLSVRSYLGASARLGETLPLFVAAGGIQGRFAQLDTEGFARRDASFPFLAPRIAYEPNAVTVTLARSDIPFVAAARTRNQAAVAVAAGTLPATSPVAGALASLDFASAPGAFRALSGEVHASAVTTQIETSHVVRDAVLDRMRWGTVAGFGGPSVDGIGQRFAPGTTMPAAYTADRPGRPPVASDLVLQPAPSPIVAWGQGFGVFGSTGTDGNAARLNRQTSGFVLGADAAIGGAWRLGAAGGYTFTSFDLSGTMGSGSIETRYGSIYGTGDFGPVQVRLGGLFGGSSLMTQRTAGLAGIGNPASASYGGQTLQGFGEIGYRVPLAGGFVEPFVGASALQVSQDRVRESGSFAALTVMARDTDLATTTLGLRAEWQVASALEGTTPVLARGLIGYRRAYGDVTPKALLAFDASSSFLTAGIPIDRDAFVTQVGLDWVIAPSTTLGIAYAGQIGARAADHGAKGRFTYAF